jgi:DNA-3-methyladenine glycosylase I
MVDSQLAGRGCASGLAKPVFSLYKIAILLVACDSMTETKPDLITHDDGKARCWWPGTDPLYVAYHDTDWGVPETDSRALFEKLVLDGFQAGLSWITILRKRENFRKAFDNFNAETIVRYSPEKLDALMQDAGIVRNRAKIIGTVPSARVYLEIEARQGFANYLWGFVDGRPLQPNLTSRSAVLAETKVSQAISKDLKSRGFTFCGPTIVYAFMQAVGMTNDHLTGCFRHAEVAELGRKLKVG